MNRLLIILLLVMSSQVLGQPTISFTFDDGVTNDYPGYPFEVWNRMLLNKLDNAEINAIFFVTGHNKIDQKGKFLLESWNGQGHKIANHTYSHPNYNHDEVSTTAFAGEILRTDSVISNYENCIKLFRFPYLKEGNTEEKVDSIRQFLQAQGYRNGYVTIDASDWYINSRLRKRLANDPQSPVEGYKQFYLDHLFDRAQFYENLSYELTGRHIHHTLLLHHNLAAALFLDDLIEMFKAKGWKVVSADKAYEDPVFDKTPKFAGESLIYALAKDAGRFSNKLRYPAEDGKYEKEKMDRLGL